MKKSKLLLHFLFLAIITIIAGCGDGGDHDSSSGVTITTSSSLAPIIVNTASSMTLVASGGTAPYTWALAQGSTLPPGLSLSSGGVISGSPTRAGAYNFSITVTDSANPPNTASQSFSLTVNLDITTAAALGSVTANTPLAPITLAVSGGTAPYTWALAAGSALPAGLSLSSGGVISGTPTTAGTYNFSITVTDSATPAGTASKAFSIIVTSPATPLTVTTASLPGATVGTAYSQALAASGGTSPYTWSISAGALPAGLTLIAGTISGTPTTAGTANFTVMVTDSATPAGTATKALSIIVASGPVVPTAPTITGATGGTNSVTISWNPVTGATSYNLYWSTVSGLTTATGTKITGVTSPSRHSRLTAAPTWLAANTPYFYIVTAVNAVGESNPSGQATATTSATDGVALYGTNCAGCHNPLATSEKQGRTATQIQNAINGNDGGMGFLSTLTAAQVQAIAYVLAAGF